MSSFRGRGVRDRKRCKRRPSPARALDTARTPRREARPVEELEVLHQELDVDEAAATALDVEAAGRLVRELSLHACTQAADLLRGALAPGAPAGVGRRLLPHVPLGDGLDG